MADDELTRPAHVDGGTLHAWLDGALAADEGRAVEAHIAACSICSAAAAEARGLIAASSRILSALDDVSGDVIPTDRKESGTNRTPVRSRSFALRYGPIAAVAVFAIGAALVVSSRHGTEPLASTLQSASTEPLSVAGASNAAAAAKATSQLPSERAANEERATASARKVSPTAPAPVQSAPVTSPSTKASTMADASLSRDMAQAMTDPSGLRAKVAVEPVLPPPGVSAGTRRLDAPLSTISLAPGAITADAYKRLAHVADSLPPTMTGATMVSTTQSIENVSHVRSTVFQLDSGVTVTLTERRSLTPEEAATVEHDTTTSSVGIVLRGTSFTEQPSVMWLGRNGTVLTLSGALPVKKLQALKERIVE